MPGGPTRVTSRVLSRIKRVRKAPISCSRPIRGVTGAGKFAGDRNGARTDVDRSARAKSTNARCFSGAMSSALASNSAIWQDGRRSPDSIFCSVDTAHPTRRASSACVKSSDLRRCLSHAPNEIEAFIIVCHDNELRLGRTRIDLLYHYFVWKSVCVWASIRLRACASME